jgi:hypothetical protein
MGYRLGVDVECTMCPITANCDRNLKTSIEVKHE